MVYEHDLWSKKVTQKEQFPNKLGTRNDGDNFLIKARRPSQQLLVTQILFIIYVAKYKNLHNKMLKNKPNIPVHCGQQ